MRKKLELLKKMFAWSLDYARRLPFLEWSDRAFLWQAGDPATRRAEIVRMKIRRRNFTLIAAVLFAVIMLIELSDRSPNPVTWIIFLIQMLVWQDIQNRLRMLQLVEQMQFPR